MNNTKEYIGRLTVDSGLVYVGDPCYLSDGRNPFELWDKFVQKMGSDEWIAMPHDDGVEGKGITVGGFGGDGTYPVYVERGAGGLVSRIIIDFKADA